MVAAELNIVVDEIEVRFRPNEKVVKDVKLNPASHVPQKVIGTDEVRAGEEAASHEALVKTDAFATNSAFQLGRCVFTQRRRKDGVEVVKNGTKRQESLREIPGCAPGHVATYAKMVEEQNVAAETRKYASPNGLREEITSSIEG